MIIIKNEELMKYSLNKLRTLIQPDVRIRHTRKKTLIKLTGMETVEPALGGELIRDEIGNYYLGGEIEPSGIRLLDGQLIGIKSIEEIIIDC
jgi:hypothetical protein